MDRDSGGLPWVVPSLGRYHVGLVLHGLSNEDLAVLDNRCSVAEDEVHRAIDVAVTIELALGVDEEGVLVGFEAAPVEDRAVRFDPESYGLVLLWPGSVLKCHVPGPKTVSRHTCNSNLMFIISLQSN